MSALRLQLQRQPLSRCEQASLVNEAMLFYIHSQGIIPMAHLVEQMAYVGATPWHGLGSRLSPKQPLEIWQREAGRDWQIQESLVHFKADTIGHLGSIHTFPEQKVLYRSDTKAPLSVVSQRYQVVQPREVLEFYRDLTEVSGYELETAGVLKGGRKFWALRSEERRVG